MRVQWFTRLKVSSDEQRLMVETERGSNPNGKIIVDQEFGQMPIISWGLLRFSLESEELITVFKPSPPQSSSKPILNTLHYTQGEISLGKTAEMCGMYYDEIVEELIDRGLKLNFGPPHWRKLKKKAKS